MLLVQFWPFLSHETSGESREKERECHSRVTAYVTVKTTEIVNLLFLKYLVILTSFINENVTFERKSAELFLSLDNRTKHCKRSH